MKRYLLTAMVFAFTLAARAEAREHQRHADDVTVTTTLAQRIAARAVISTAAATSIEEAHDLIALVDDLDFAGSASYLEHLPPAKLKAFTFETLPATAKPARLSRTEAKVLVKWLVPSPKAPWDAGFARVVLGLVDAVNEALGPPTPPPVAKK